MFCYRYYMLILHQIMLFLYHENTTWFPQYLGIQVHVGRLTISIRRVVPGITAYKIEYKVDRSAQTLSARYNGPQDRVRGREISSQAMSARYNGLQDRARDKEISSQTLSVRYNGLQDRVQVHGGRLKRSAHRPCLPGTTAYKIEYEVEGSAHRPCLPGTMAYKIEYDEDRSDRVW